MSIKRKPWEISEYKVITGEAAGIAEHYHDEAKRNGFREDMRFYIAAAYIAGIEQGKHEERQRRAARKGGSIAERLIQARGERKKRDVCAACGISLASLKEYEAGRRIPRDEVKERLAAYYNADVNAIFN